MTDKNATARCLRWYRKLLRCYPKSHRDRFGESMEQTFRDLCREHRQAGRGSWSFVLWVFTETFVGIIRENGRLMMTQNGNVVRIAIGTGCLLAIPYLAGWPWGLFDYFLAGVLLAGTGLAFELISRKGRTSSYRAAVGVACATGLLLLWMNLAVGLIGNESNPANLLYIGVAVVGLCGALIARLEPRGMAMALIATAIAQASVPLIAMIIWRPAFSMGVVLVLAVNALFVVLWLGSTLLFRHAGAPLANSQSRTLAHRHGQ